MKFFKRFLKDRRSEPSATEQLIDQRMVSIQKKKDTADEIIEMMSPRNFQIERRICGGEDYEGPERRTVHA